MTDFLTRAAANAFEQIVWYHHLDTKVYGFIDNVLLINDIYAEPLTCNKVLVDNMSLILADVQK